jgi:hemoglobin
MSQASSNSEPVSGAPNDADAPIVPYALLGGDAGIRRLVDRFYEIMDQEPAAAAIRAMHPADLSAMRERLAAYLSGWLGGPPLFFTLRPGVCIMSAHKQFAIGAAERDAWLFCMTQALAEMDVSESTRALLKEPFFRIADAFCSD